jgi:hypothetical protein
VDFFFYSLVETMYGYMGLALQSLLRHSSLAVVPFVLVLLWTVVLVVRAAGNPARLWGAAGYVLTSLILLVLFWPEALLFRRGLTVTGAGQVASYPASQDPQADIRTAEETGQVWPALRDPAFVTPGFRLLLRITTELPLALARALNDETHRTFSALMPMQWLLGVDLTQEVLTDVGDWVHNCYLPALTAGWDGASARTAQQLLPWGDTPMRAALETRSVTPGSQTGATFLSAPDSGGAVPCSVYLSAVEFRTQGWLFEKKTPAGAPLSQVVQEQLGDDVERQARFVIYREILKALPGGAAVPAPSLAGVYAGLRGAALAGKTLEGGVLAGAASWLSGAFSWATTLFGAGRGAAAGLGSEFQRFVDGLSWIVGIAVFLTWFGPYLLGIALFVTIGLFTFALLWALIPGQQFQAMAGYVMFLLYVSLAPLWWASVDLLQKLAAPTAPQSDDLILGLGNASMQFLYSTSITVLGILLVPVLTGVVFFAAYRAGASLWRGVV